MCFTFPSHLTSASAVTGEMPKHINCILSLKHCITVLPDFQQVAGLIYSVLLLATHTHAIVWIPIHGINSTLLWSHSSGSWQLCTAAVGLSWTQDAPVHCLGGRQYCHQQIVDDNIVLTTMHLTASNICLDNKILTRNGKHRRAAAKPAACAKPLMLSTLGSKGEERRVR